MVNLFCALYPEKAAKDHYNSELTLWHTVLNFILHFHRMAVYEMICYQQQFGYQMFSLLLISISLKWKMVSFIIAGRKGIHMEGVGNMF